MSSKPRLLDAIGSGDLDAVREVLSRQPERASVGAEEEESPILAALYGNRMEIVDLLLERATPDLFEAAALGDVPRLRERLAEDPAALGRRTRDGWTSLHLAAFFGHREAAEVLLEAGAPLEATSGNAMANRPLHAAIAGRTDPAVVGSLLRRGADASARAATGVTPLHLAASRGSEPVIDLLLDHGADPAARMEDGSTAADVAESRGHPDVARRLRGLAG